MPPLALPLAPVAAPGATAAALTAAAATVAYVGQQVNGFRAPLPPLPRADGKAGQGTLGKLVADAISAINVGVASLPNPLGPEGSAGGLLLSELYDLLSDGPPDWGQLNGPPREGPPGFATPGDTPSNISTSGQIGRNGYTTTISWTVGVSYWMYVGGDPACMQGSFPPTSGSITVNKQVTGVRHQGTGTRICGGYDQLTVAVMSGEEVLAYLVSASGGGGIIKADASVSFSTNDPNPIDGTSGGGAPTPWAPTAPFGGDDFAPIPPDFPPLPAPAGPAPGGGGLAPAGVGVSGSAIEQPGPAPGARPVPLAPMPTPAYVPAAVPWATPQTQPQPQPQPSQVPGSTPTRTPTLPTPAPGTFPGTDPARPTLPTAPDATVKPPDPAPVPTTPADSIIPWPGARPIPGTGPAPRPDLPGIAQELGRIERKIEQMNTPANPVMGQKGPLDLIGLARAIFEILTALNSGTVYTMDSPCEVDELGQKKPAVEVEVPGGITPFAAMYARIDALAQLLQVHKNLKQPSCKGVKPSGEWVTVQFEEFFP